MNVRSGIPSCLVLYEICKFSSLWEFDIFSWRLSLLTAVSLAQHFEMWSVTKSHNSYFIVIKRISVCRSSLSLLFVDFSHCTDWSSLRPFMLPAPPRVDRVLCSVDGFVIYLMPGAFCDFYPGCSVLWVVWCLSIFSLLLLLSECLLLCPSCSLVLCHWPWRQTSLTLLSALATLYIKCITLHPLSGECILEGLFPLLPSSLFLREVSGTGKFQW